MRYLNLANLSYLAKLFNDMTDSRQFTLDLLDWFKAFGRHDLPWRQDFDPYKVWVSEIMLQQTQVPRVAEYFYPRFLQQFPTLPDFAGSSWEEVYPFWRGLGFYRRGKNMLKTAQIVQERYAGVFPSDFEALVKLPGVGTYTACAILSFAFDKPFAAVDTNIFKIIGVLWPSEKPEVVALRLLEFSDSPRDWNGAMMDLGTVLRSGQKIEGNLGRYFPEEVAMQFLPNRKKLEGKEKILRKKSNNRRIEVGIGCIWKDGKYLIQTRPSNKSFPGYWEFPGGKREKGEDFRGCVKREIIEEIGVEVSVRPHFFEEIHHFDTVDLVLRFHRCQIQSGEPQSQENQELKWVRPGDFASIQFLETNKNALELLRRIKI